MYIYIYIYIFATFSESTGEKQAPQFLKGIQDVEVVEGRTVKFRCKIRGYPQPRVLWYKDGKRIFSGDNYLTGELQVITVTS